MAAQHDLGTRWHGAFCAVEPCWGSNLAAIQPLEKVEGEEEETGKKKVQEGKKQ